jgi:hypothetical protein
MSLITDLCGANEKNSDMANSKLELTDNKLADKADFDLIKGDFTTDEASEILNYLIDKKIRFHRLKRFSTEIRFGGIDENSEQRCEELKESKTSMNEFIQLAKKQGRTLRIKSSLSIEII